MLKFSWLYLWTFILFERWVVLWMKFLVGEYTCALLFHYYIRNHSWSCLLLCLLSRKNIRTANCKTSIKQWRSLSSFPFYSLRHPPFHSWKPRYLGCRLWRSASRPNFLTNRPSPIWLRRSLPSAPSSPTHRGFMVLLHAS